MYTNETSVDALNMTNATKNLLKRNGIRTREALAAMSIEEFSKLPSVASKRCYEILKAVRESE